MPRGEFTHKEASYAHEAHGVTYPKLEDIDNDELIHVDVTRYTDDDYFWEGERILKIVEANVTTGLDLTYWYDRDNHIREMRRLREVLA
jgi:hypothetical protein